jgi:hypothetical protein
VSYLNERSPRHVITSSVRVQLPVIISKICVVNQIYTYYVACKPYLARWSLVVTLCTTRLSIKKFAFGPFTTFLSCVWSSEFIAVHRTNCGFFTNTKGCVYCAVTTGTLNKIQVNISAWSFDINYIMWISVRIVVYVPSVLRLSSPVVESETAQLFFKLGEATCLQAFPLLHTRKAYHSILRKCANNEHH